MSVTHSDRIEVNMGGEEEEGREGQTHYVVEQFVAEVRIGGFSCSYRLDKFLLTHPTVELSCP